MGLKPDRHEFQTDISYFMNENAERGGMVVLNGNPSGVAMDSPVNLVTYAANPSGKVPIGILLNDMTGIDLTRQKINPYKNEVAKGGKVTILKKGYVVTNMIHPTGTPVAGADAYLADSGLFSTSVRALALDSGAKAVGKFRTSADDGWVKISIDLL